ncbi:MAG: nucleotidyl transferase AbiEii/AbiGii toxin family protein [Bryobacterales bacterium]|nr:nucleotidyl transferase AbiEii/AbiGii toxin family protein [Bryobacterales bacterium]
MLDSTRRLLAHFVREQDVLLGGGTALASRWRHRKSVDIDLFVDPSTYRRNILARSEECLDRLRQLGFLRLAAVGEEGIGLQHGGGKVDIVACFPVTGHDRSRDVVAGTGIAVETNAEILAKKLHRRILGHGRILPRDLYDLAYARRFEPEALEAAWDARRVADPDVLVAALGSFSPGWMDRHEERVEGARYPELLSEAVDGLLSDALARFAGRRARRGA